MRETPSASQPPVLRVELTDAQGHPVTVQLNEAQARHLLEKCVHAFGWNAARNPFTESFLKTFTAGLNIADKIEGGG